MAKNQEHPPVLDDVAKATIEELRKDGRRSCTVIGKDIGLCESDDHLLDLISHQIRAVPGILSTETCMYLRLEKQTYAWGVR